LADVIKRIGLVERTGRGIDMIYQGLLRYGRPEPDYSRSDSTTIVVHLSSAKADLPFLRMVLEEEKRTGTPILLDALIILAQLRAC
jgi:ATP-dependent DNA helicase RecG